MSKKIRDHKLLFRRLFLISYDIAAILMASALALLLRFELDYNAIDDRFIEAVWKYIPINIIVTLIVFYFFKLYSSLWAFAGVSEMQNIVAACILTSVIQMGGMLLLDLRPPRSFYVLYGMVFLFLIMLSRFSYRAIRLVRRKKRLESEGRRTMVIGAGEAGSMIIKEIMTSEHLNLKVACAIDDDPAKIGSYIQGVKVVGDRTKIVQYTESMAIDEIIIAMPAVRKSKIKDIIDICKETGCELKILPGIYQLMNGEVSVSKLRNVEIEDLLGREPVSVNLNQIMGYIEGKLTPIVPATGVVDALDYINPIPQGLVLTGIVVSVSFSALMLALTVRLYRKYRTLNLDKIYEMCRKEDEQE